MTEPLARTGVVAVLVGLAGCAPAPLALPGFEDARFLAALVLDADQELASASELRALEAGAALDLFTADDAPLVIVGWPADAFGSAIPEPGAALGAHRGCEPRLPAPLAAARLDGDAIAPYDPAAVPALTAPWATTLCPSLDPARFVFRAECSTSRVVSQTRSTSACTFELDLATHPDTLEARIEPEGTLCVGPARQGGSACAPLDTRAPADSSFSCQAAEPCPVDVYLTPAVPPLEARSVPLLAVPPFLPDSSLTGTQPQLPPYGQYVGYTHDLVVLDDVVIVSTSTGAARLLCSGSESPSVLHAHRLDDLSLAARREGAPSCLSLLARTGTSALGLYVEGPRFALARITAELEVTRVAALDDRTDPASVPPLARADCERPIDLIVEPSRVVLVSERLPHCGEPGTTVHVLDPVTLAARSRHDLAHETPWRALLDADHLLLAQATGRAVLAYDARTFVLDRRLELMPDLARNDFVIADVAIDGDHVLAATTRNQPAIRRSTGGAFVDRGFFLGDEADPVALWPRLDGERGLVIGVRDGDRARWPAEAALYDAATLTVFPGSTPIGHGPPRRLRADGRGGVLALLPWEATLVRIRVSAR